MINLTEALTKSETDALLALIRANNLPIEALACHMTRQQGHGRGRHSERGGFSILSGQSFNISYNLLLCEYCGHLEPQKPCCPARLCLLREKLLQSNGKPMLNSATDE